MERSESKIAESPQLSWLWFFPRNRHTGLLDNFPLKEMKGRDCPGTHCLYSGVRKAGVMLTVVVHACDIGTQEMRQQDHEFKTHLSYIMNLRFSLTK